MTEVSRRGIDPDSILDYCQRASDLGLTGNDEFHSLLALLHGAQLPTQKSSRDQAKRNEQSPEAEPEQQQLDRAAALHGRRGPMPLRACCHEQAAGRLLSADAMLAACPHHEGAKCARVEALIECSRWEDAGSACARLLPGVDRLYLHSEQLWRQGQVPAAVKALKGAQSSNPDSHKCSERLTFLQPIMEELQQASTAMEEGDMQRCEEGCSGVLQELQDCGCSGLQALVHTQRAACRLLRSDLQGALDDCCAALAAEPGSPDALHLKYQVYQESSRHVEAFLQLQQLRQVAPRYPGLSQLMTAAAEAATGAREGHGRRGLHKVVPGSHYAVLGLTMAASQKEVQSAYRRQATKWHPDKWATAAPEAQQSAAEKFLQVQSAHEVLADPTERARYNARQMS